MITLDDIEKKVEELAAKINVPTDSLPTYGYTKDYAYPHIEVDNVGFLHYVIVERGQEIDRKTTEKLDDLLYWIFSNVTYSMACNYELENRIKDKDWRRIMFDKQVELLGQLSDNWKQKEKAKHQSILNDYPFKD